MSRLGSAHGHARLRSLRPGRGVVARFIILSRSQPASAAHTRGGGWEQAVPEFWVADESASVALVLRGRDVPDAGLLGSGEIFWLRCGEAVLDRDGRLTLILGASGKLERDGYLTMAFEEEPYLSAGPWESVAKTLPAPAPAPAVEADHGVAEEREDPAAPRADPEDGVQKPDSRSSACFLCGAPDHAVFDCSLRERGVVVSCPALDAGPPKRRHLAMQQALRASGLPEAQNLRWYEKKEARRLYVCFKSQSEASIVLDFDNFQIEGQPARLYEIRAPVSKGSVGKKHLWPGRKGTARKSSQQGEMPGASTTEKDEAAAPASSGEACFLCASSEHSLAACPSAKLSVCVTGAEKAEAFDLRSLLGRCGGVVHSSQWHGSKCYVQLADAKQANNMCSKARDGSVVLNGRRLSIFPCLTARPDSATGAAPPVQQQGAKRQIAGGRDESQPKRPRTRDGPVGADRKACFLCGEPGHELPACPKRSHCVIVCRDWGTASAGAPYWPGGLREALGKVLQHAGFNVARTQFVKGVCYAQLGGPDEVSQLLTSTGMNGLLVAGEVVRVREARSTRTQADTSEAKASDAKASEPPVEDCPLCGAKEHAAQACHLRSRAAVFRCDAFQADREAGQAEVAQVLGSVCAAPAERLLWQQGALYAVLATEEDAVKLVEVAAGEGLEVSGELVSVERAGQAAPKGAGGQAGGGAGQRAAGLRPRAGRRNSRHGRGAW